MIKLNYIHNNPLQERWSLCGKVEDYRFSSAKYYFTGEDVGIRIVKIAGSLMLMEKRPPVGGWRVESVGG